MTNTNAVPLTNEQIEAVLEEAVGHWVDDEYRINGKDLMNLCRAMTLLSASKPAAPPRKEIVAHLFNKHGGPVPNEGWCLNESGLNDFLTELFAASPAAPAQSGVPVAWVPDYILQEIAQGRNIGSSEKRVELT